MIPVPVLGEISSESLAAGRRPLKVLYVGPRANAATGSSMVFRDLVRSLNSKRVRFALVSFGQGSEQQLCPVNGCVQIYSDPNAACKGILLTRALRRIRLLRRAQQDFCPDIMVADLRIAIFLTCAMASLRLIRVPLVVRWGAMVRTRSRLESLALLLKIRMMLPFARWIIVPTAMVRRDLMARFGVKEAQIRVIPNAIDTSRFESPKSTTPEKVQEPVAMAIGTLNKEKSPATLIRAAAEMHRRGVDLHVWLIGDGPLRSELTSMARQLHVDSKTKFVGTVPNPAPFYQAADIYVCCSLADGFNITLLEAVYFRKPIIYADASVGFVDVLKEAGLGVAFTPGDYRELASAIEDVLAARRGQVDQAKYESIVSRFSIDRFAQDYHRLLLSTVAQAKRKTRD